MERSALAQCLKAILVLLGEDVVPIKPVEEAMQWMTHALGRSWNDDFGWPVRGMPINRLTFVGD